MSTSMIIFVIILSATVSALGWRMQNKLRGIGAKQPVSLHFHEKSVSKKVDPNGRRKTYIVVFLTVIAFFGFRFYSERNKSIAMSEKCSDITQGTVVSVEHKNGYRSSDRTNIVYRYKVGNIIYEIDTTYRGIIHEFKEGGTYSVHYDPDEPKLSYIGDVTPQTHNTDFYIILMAVFGLLTLGLMLTWKKVPPEDRRIY